MSQLKIIFDGAIVIGPAHPCEPPYENQGPLYAVLPRALRHESRRTTLNPIADAEYIPVHFPVIFTNLKSEGRDPDDEYKGWNLWYPVRERMDVWLDGNADPGTLTYPKVVVPGGPGPGAPAGPVPVHDIRAVSDLRRVWPERSWLRKGMLDRRWPVAPEVAAQVFIPSGSVGGGGTGIKRCGVPVTYLPPRTPEPVEATIVPHVAVTVDVDRIDIALFSLDTGEALDPISFINIPHGAEIRIANADPREIRTVIDEVIKAGASPPESVPCYDPRKASREDDLPDVDFELLYQVLAGGDDGGGLPIPWVPFRVGNRNCFTGLVSGEEES